MLYFVVGRPQLNLFYIEVDVGVGECVFSVGHLLHIVTEEDKVNTAESELSDDKEQVH